MELDEIEFILSSYKNVTEVGVFTVIDDLGTRVIHRAVSSVASNLLDEAQRWKLCRS